MLGLGEKKGKAGRPKGLTKEVLRARKAEREAAEEAQAKAVQHWRRKKMTPLDYMLEVMRNPRAPVGRRDRMATAAAPYIHARLASMEVVGDPTKPVVFTMLNRPPKIIEEQAKEVTSEPASTLPELAYSPAEPTA